MAAFSSLLALGNATSGGYFFVNPGVGWPGLRARGGDKTVSCRS